MLVNGGRVTGLEIPLDLSLSKLMLGFLTNILFCLTKALVLSVGVRGGSRTGLAVLCFM